MAMMENGNGEWSEGLEEELIRELLDEESPEVIESEPTLLMNSAMINFLASKVYSGPTIRDIQEALSITNRDAEASDQSNIMGSGNLVLDDDLGSQSERRFTLEIKCSGNGAADDGYKWRKYGQKSIKNSSYPRSYYKCTIPRCGAKKQVERSSKDPNTLVITYEGLHFHFAYSHFLQPQTHQLHSPTKKLKKNSSHSKAQKGIETHIQAEESPLIVKSTVRRQDHFIKNVSSQGSLQDVVPLMILKP